MQRLLIIARHYPPAISGGARRPYLLAAGLRRAGVDVRIIAPSLPEGEPGSAVPHPNRDPAPGSGPPGFDLRAVARDLLLWPDPDIRWSRRAAARAIADGWRPDWVLSTSPPESIHVAGEAVARALGARWAADFRDLWLEAPHRRERRRPHRRVGERLIARRLLPRAALVIAVDPVVAEEARRLGARDPKVLAHFTAEPDELHTALPADTLNIVHAGSIAFSDPEAQIGDLLAPFTAAWHKRPELRLILAGRLTLSEAEAIGACRASSAIARLGPIPYQEARALMAGADGLALVASPKMHVPPSKIADYLAFDVPIIACGAGPWRTDPRLPGQTALDALLTLHRGAGRNHDGKARFSAAAADEFLAFAQAAMSCNQP